MKNIIELLREIRDFKKGYQLRTNIVKDEKGDLVTDCKSIFIRWRKHFSQLFNVRGVGNVRQAEIHTAAPLVPETSAFVDEMTIEKLTVTNHHLLIKSQQNCLRQMEEQFALGFMNLSILFGIRRNCLKRGRSRSLYLSIRREIKQTVVITEAYHICQLRTKFYPTFCCQS